jgi:glucose uptake protein
MLIPTTYGVTILVLLLSMIFWGSWANTQKLTGKWRFELYYFDFALGLLLIAILCAFTLGSMGSELSFEDNMSITGKRQMFIAIAAGAVFNLANVMFVAAMTVTGMAIATMLSLGLALVIGALWRYISHPAGSAMLLFGGVLVVLAALAAAFKAYQTYTGPDPAVKTKRKVKTKGLLLSIISGLLMGSYYPVVEMSKQGENGLGAYSIAVMFAIGVFISTFLFNLYFMNLPVVGETVPISQYFSGSLKPHALGLAGGALWGLGLVANLVAAAAPRTADVSPALSYGIGNAGILLAALWGIYYWNEFSGAAPKVNQMILLMLGLFAAGLSLIAISPVF